MDVEERLTLLEKQVRMLEEEVCYCHKDMANLINIIENVQPENHTHYTMITENVTCTACDPNNTNDLKDLT
jgi:hypothetical protein